MKQLAQGKSTEEAMQFLAHTLMNKFLHQPSIQLRQAGQDSRHDLIEFARQLFLGKDTDKTEDKK